MLEIPKILYHATLEDNYMPIILNGLKKSYDGIYFCDNAQDAAKFLVFKAMAHNQNIFVIEVNTDSLNRDSFREGNDHSSKFFENPNVFVYKEDISNRAIEDKYWEFDIKDIMNREDD